MNKIVKIKDLTGKRFGRLVVLEQTGERNKYGYLIWKCKCDCGNIKEVPSCRLNKGLTKSCGCLAIECKSKRTKTHGLSNTRIYKTYLNMKDRCYNSNNKEYKDYGGRGIIICDYWLNKENGLVNFYNWSMSHGYNDNLTIDRINVDGNYEPGNCRWIPKSLQSSNRRCNNYITYKGITDTLSGWARRLNVSRESLKDRLRSGWSIEETLEIPVVKGQKIKINNK